MWLLLFPTVKLQLIFIKLKYKRETLIENLRNLLDIFVITCLIILSDGANRYIKYKIFLDMYENTQIPHFSCSILNDCMAKVFLL